MPYKISCIVLAAGSSSRFHEDKLSYEINGNKLIDITLNKLKDLIFYNIVVVTGNDYIIDKAKSYGYKIAVNKNPELGQSLSIKLGIEKTDKSDGYMFIVSDQPNLTKKTIIKLMDTFIKNPESIIVPKSYNGFGNPVIFPKSLINEFNTLTGDMGGKYIIKNNLSKVITVDVNENELLDIDTKDDIKKI